MTLVGSIFDLKREFSKLVVSPVEMLWLKDA